MSLNKKPNRSKLRDFLVVVGDSIISLQAAGIYTQQTIKKAILVEKTIKMAKKELSKFLSIFFLTIFLMRMGVFILQERSLFLFGKEIHHFFIGVALLIISGFSRFFSNDERFNKYDLLVFAVGVGLVADEITFLVLTEGAHQDYFSIVFFFVSLIITGLLSIIFSTVYYLETKQSKKTIKK